MFSAQQNSKQLVFVHFHRFITVSPGAEDEMNCSVLFGEASCTTGKTHVPKSHSKRLLHLNIASSSRWPILISRLTKMDLKVVGRGKEKKKRKKGFPPFLWIYTDFFKIVLLLWRTSKWGKNYTLFLLKSRERHKGWQRLRYNRKPKIKLQNSGLDAITTFPSTSNESRVLWKKISE